MESLNETVTAFLEAVESIRRSDPVAIKEMLVCLEEDDRISARLRVAD